MSELRAGYARPRYASAQEAAGVAAECAQIIRRNEAETAMRRDLMEHARAEIERHLSLDRSPTAADVMETFSIAGAPPVEPEPEPIPASNAA